MVIVLPGWQKAPIKRDLFLPVSFARVFSVNTTCPTGDCVHYHNKSLVGSQNELRRTHSQHQTHHPNQKPIARTGSLPRPAAVRGGDQYRAAHLGLAHPSHRPLRGCPAAATPRFVIRERKRGKRHDVVINASIGETLGEYLAAYPDIAANPDHFVFFRTAPHNYAAPIGRGQAWKFITAICREVGLRGNYGTHSLRKTWGYHARMQRRRSGAHHVQAQPCQPGLHQTLSGHHRRRAWRPWSAA